MQSHLRDPLNHLLASAAALLDAVGMEGPDLSYTDYRRVTRQFERDLAVWQSLPGAPANTKTTATALRAALNEARTSQVLCRFDELFGRMSDRGHWTAALERARLAYGELRGYLPAERRRYGRSARPPARR